MGFPTRMFTVLFAIGRLPGWLAHWREMQTDPQTKIGRPQQLYIGRREARLPGRRLTSLDLDGRARSVAQFVDDRRMRVAPCVRTEDDVEVPVAGELVMRVPSGGVCVEVLERATLTLREEAPVVGPGQEREPASVFGAAIRSGAIADTSPVGIRWP